LADNQRQPTLHTLAYPGGEHTAEAFSGKKYVNAYGNPY